MAAQQPALDLAAQLLEGLQASLPELRAFMPWAHFPRNCAVASQAGRLEALTRQWDEGHGFVFHIFLKKVSERNS